VTPSDKADIHPHDIELPPVIEIDLSRLVVEALNSSR
jgi:hypothetical protein